MSEQNLSAAQRLEAFPPFHNMGIKVLDFVADWQIVRLLLPFTSQNKNPGGTMFGGAIASLADPIAALACVYRFPGYAVWTKSLTVDFVKPGSSDLQLLFEFPSSASAEISDKLAKNSAADHTFYYGLYLNDSSLCARISCVVALRPHSAAGSCIKR